MIVARWCDLTHEERRFVVRAVRSGVSGDLLMPSLRWYRTKPRGWERRRALAALNLRLAA